MMNKELFCKCVESIEQSLLVREEIAALGLRFQDDDAMLRPFMELIDKMMTPERHAKDGFVFRWISDYPMCTELNIGDESYPVSCIPELYEFIMKWKEAQKGE